MCSFLPGSRRDAETCPMLQCKLDMDQGCDGNLWHREACPSGLGRNRQAPPQSSSISKPVP